MGRARPECGGQGTIEPALSFQCASAKDSTQVIRLGSKPLNPLCHFRSLLFYFNK